MALNVNRNVQDNFYRYKMPRLIAKVEGKGNGVKTVIPNMVEIARALGRPPTYCTKYFGCELGAQTQFDFKNDRYIVNGAHDAGKLQDMLDGFIKRFVLCEKCENPETVMRVNSKKGIITASCKACGHINQLDMRHKLTTFIIKNPPDQALAAHGTSLTKRKDKKSQRREQEKGHEDETDTHDAPNTCGRLDNSGDDDDWGERNNPSDQWSLDVSSVAVKKRMKELTSGVKHLAMDDDMEKSESERVNIFHKFVTSKIEAGDLTGKDKEILNEAERLEIINKAPIILCELLFDENMVSQIRKNKRLLLRFNHNNTKAQKYFMGGFEKTVELHKSALLPKVVTILKTLYDEDIVEEEVLMEWSKKVSKKYVSKDLSEQIHKKAEPFISWLKLAEEESSEDSDNEVELTFDERAKISTIQEEARVNGQVPESGAPTKERNPSRERVEEDEDIDIDNI